MQVIACAAGGDLGDQLGRALDIIVLADPALPATLTFDEEQVVRLGHVVEVEADAGVVAAPTPGVPSL